MFGCLTVSDQDVFLVSAFLLMVCSYHGKAGLNPIEADLQVDELPLDKLLDSIRGHTHS